MTYTPTLDLQKGIAQETLLRRITNRIRQSLELEDIIQTTTDEVRALLGTDRVMIYKFNDDGSGQVVSESIYKKRLPSLLGLNFPADDIPPQARELFINSRVRSVVNVATREIGQSPVQNLANGETLAEDIAYRTVDPCHVEYLTAMGVMSSVVAPIFHQNEFWGLLVSHHSKTREVTEEELDAMQMVVEQLSVAIAHNHLLTQTRAQARQEAIINKISTLLHSLPTIVLQPALEATVSALNGVGGRLCIRHNAFDLHTGGFKNLSECLTPGNDCVRVYLCGQQPILPEPSIYQILEQYSVWQEHYKTGNYDIWAINDIFQDPNLRIIQATVQDTKIRGLLMIPLHYRQQLVGYLTIFRNSIDTETLWAGRFNPDQRNLYPRLSFTAWCESKKGQPQPWANQEIELAREIGKHFASAVQQHELYQQIQNFNFNLEKQVQQRTLEMRRTADQQQTVFKVINKIRESLDTETIFRTTTTEVCQLIKSDRVSVYRFDADWGGEFVGDFEATSPNWSNESKLGVNMVWNDTYLQDTQGGRYRYGETYAIDDIYKMGFTQCHVDILEQYYIHAFVLAPIFVGQKLWGLLCVYQHTGPRQWKSSEVNFVTQIAAQLGVALQQAELLATTQQQAEQLNAALTELQTTQSQLIQTEKMSSLGQLVAGIAHEINNPVNFICGNLTHIQEYAEDLLNLVEKYQVEYPVPSEELLDLVDAVDLEFLTEDMPKTLASMKVGVDRIRQIVLSLRNFSRIDEAEVKDVNVHDGIDSTLLILQHRFKARPESSALQIIKEYGDVPLVECFAGQLNQVFMNVISNAVDALEYDRSPDSEKRQNCKITIHTSIGELRQKPSVIIRIADNGPGIPETLKAKIFDPFFTTKPIGKGTGLGLSISYQIIVEKHGGVFKCNSQPDVGTEFWIEIPVKHC